MLPEALAGVDTALLRLRRLWEAAPDAIVDPRVGRVDLSTVLVVEVIRWHRTPGVRDVAESLDITPSTASRVVDRAVAAGMVSRAHSDVDGRRTVLSLTADGQHLCRTAATYRIRYLRRVLAQWPEEDVAEFSRLLGRFAHDVHTHPPRERSTE